MKLIVNGQDISQFYSYVKWSGDINQAARQIEFGVVVSGTDPNLPKLTIMQGDKVYLTDDNGKKLFAGNVYDKEKSIDNNIMTVTCLDNLVKANNSKASFVFENESPSSIATEAFASIGMATGELADGAPIDRTFDIDTVYNIALTAYRIEYEKSGTPFLIRMDGERVTVVEKGKQVAKWILDGTSNLINAKYGESSKDAIGEVLIYDKDGNATGSVKGDWGGGVDIYREEEGEDAFARAEAMLKGIEKVANVTAFGDYDLITGNAVQIKEPYTGLIGKFYIDADEHTFENNYHVVDLTLSYENIMADIDTSVQRDSTGSESSIFDELGGDYSNLDGTIGQKAIQIGSKLTGTKYTWGGNTPSTGVDCSGFVQYTFNQAGAKIPGRLTSAALRSNPKAYGFQEIPFSQRQPGDVLWSSGHVGIQYDSTRIIESGGLSKNILGYSGVAISNGKGRSFNKAYRYVG